MVTRTLDTQVRREKIPVSLEAAQHLDVFCVALAVMKTGQSSLQTDSILAGLGALVDLITGQGNAGIQSNWYGRFSPSPSGNGGTLFLEDLVIRQQVIVCRDYRGSFYGGIWSRNVSEKNVDGLLFDVFSSAGGYRFEVTDGVQVQSCSLGKELPGLTWAQPPALEEVLPDELRGRRQVGASAPGSILGASGQAKPLLQEPASPPTVELRLPVLLLIRQSDGYIFALQGRLDIGRGKENNLVLEDNEISRNHAVIEPTPAGWQIRDLNSTNGTWLNGVRITSPVLLTAGDMLEIGRIKLRLQTFSS